MSQCSREFRLSLITDEEPRLNSLSINPPTPGSRTRQIQRCASVHQGKRACLPDPGLRKHGLRQVYPEYRHLPFGQRERVVVPVPQATHLARMFHQSGDQGDLGSKNRIREDLGSNWACVA